MKKVESFLEESSRHMARALGRSRVTITCQDLELKYIWVFNPDEGYEDTIGKKLEDFADRDQVDAIAPLKRRVLNLCEPFQERVTLSISGETRVFDMTVTPVLEGGKMTGITTISVDITDLLEAQEELQQAHARLLGILGDGVLTGKVRL